MKSPFEPLDKVVCINAQPMPGLHIKPPLEEGVIYVVSSITTTKDGNDHIDVGLKSKYNYISSYETGEVIPGGDSIHWCHPSRFKKLEE